MQQWHGQVATAGVGSCLCREGVRRATPLAQNRPKELSTCPVATLALSVALLSMSYALREEISQAGERLTKQMEPAPRVQRLCQIKGAF